MKVMRMARYLGLSRQIPRIPRTRDAGIERSTKHPTRELIGFPQAGCKICIRITRATSMMIKAAAILPKTIRLRGGFLSGILMVLGSCSIAAIYHTNGLMSSRLLWVDEYGSKLKVQGLRFKGIPNSKF